MNCHKLVAAAWIIAYGALAGAPTHNPRPCPIQTLESLPPNPPPPVPSPAERSAHEAYWRSNAVARSEERAAILALTMMLAVKSSMPTNGLDGCEIDATLRRGAILRAAAKRDRTSDPWPEYGTNAAAFGAAVLAGDKRGKGN